MIRAMTEVEKEVFCVLTNYHRTERFRGITRINEYRPCAFVGFDDFTANSCQMHVWLRDEHSLSKRFITECFRYAFAVCNLGLAIVVVACNNAPALDLVRRLGFNRTYDIPDGYAIGIDLAIHEMRREDCRWWPPSGRKIKHTSNSGLHGHSSAAGAAEPRALSTAD